MRYKIYRETLWN